ncbi:uncharacterized protein LOC118738562 [Rhagoletis pomonella]|uniref:uncharacterized protein LOC118738562 n=1 Tax=Rhagoletis pomonella TaxID=28610 RepID=UPI00178509D4|nr:uncharacterized protein LOC118738562 [Rhagoletis pomonella]
MCAKVDVICISFSLFCYLINTNAVNVINYQSQQSVNHVKRQASVLQSQQQQQLQRYDQPSHRTLIPSKESIFRPMVRFLNATPTQQQSQAIGVSLPLNGLARLDNQRSKTFITQQHIGQIQQQYAAPPAVVNRNLQRSPFRPQRYDPQFFSQLSQQQNFNQQRQQLRPVPSLPPLPNPPTFSQYSKYSQQQVFTFPHYVRLNQISQQQNLYQTQQPQQSVQSQFQNLNFRRPQITTATQHQQIEQYDQPVPSHIHSGVSLGRFNSTNSVISPLLPSYAEEDDALTPFNFTQPCQICCIEGQKPCQRCCDSRPLLSAGVLKSSTG